MCFGTGRCDYCDGTGLPNPQAFSRIADWLYRVLRSQDTTYRQQNLMGTLGGHFGKLSTCRRSAAPCLTWPGEVVTIRVVVNISGPVSRFAEFSVDSMPN